MDHNLSGAAKLPWTVKYLEAIHASAGIKVLISLKTNGVTVSSYSGCKGGMT